MGDAADELFDAAYRDYEDRLLERQMNSDHYVNAEGEFKVATKDAILFAQNNEEFWIPRSVLSWGSDKDCNAWKRGQNVSICLRMWFADQRGIEYVY